VVLVSIGPRPLFFGLVAVVSAALLPFTPMEFRWVNWAMMALAIFWAVMLGIEEVVAARDLRRRADRTRRGPSPG
jgi:membrane protein implicated in regulation of membrane protease activity